MHNKIGNQTEDVEVGEGEGEGGDVGLVKNKKRVLLFNYKIGS